MGIKTITIDKIKLPDWSYKKDNYPLNGILTESIKENGQIVPVHVRSLGNDIYEIIDGRRIFRVLKYLDFKEVLCFDHGKLTMDQAKLKSIQIDQIKYKTDTVDLAEIVNELLETRTPDDLSKVIPYTKQEIKKFVEYLTFDWSQFEGFHHKEQSVNFEKFFKL